MTIICCGHAEKRVQFHFMAVANFCYIRSEFHICSKSFQNAPECLKCVMIGLSCKWSLTFHYMSCLSSLKATALRSYYISDIYSCLIWLAHSGTCLEGEVKVCGKGLRVLRITTHLLISSQQPLWHLSEGKRALISLQPYAAWIYFLLRQMAAILSPSRRVYGWLKSKDALLRPSASLSCHSLSQLLAEELRQSTGLLTGETTLRGSMLHDA